MIPQVRYEFYLPFCYNDGKEIEDEKIWDLKNKLLKQFNGWTMHPRSIQGAYQSKKRKVTDYDSCCRFEITVENNPENQLFFNRKKISRLEFPRKPFPLSNGTCKKT